MKTKDFLERRGRIVADMRSITEAPTGDGGDLSAEQSAKFDGLKSELAALEKQIERRQVLDEAERKMNGERIAGTGDNRLDAELRSFSIRKAILSQVPGHSEDCSRERELSGEIARRSGRTFEGVAIPAAVFEQRVLTTAAPGGGPGSNIISTDYLGAQFIDRLRSALVTRRLGATILSGLTGNVAIPRLKVSATTGWVAENAALSASDPQFDQVTLSPKHAGGIVEFSRNMLLQSSPDIDALLRDDFAKLLARAIDSAAIKGGGSNEPVGIISTSNVATVSMTTPTWTTVLQLIEAVEGGDALEGSLGFAGNSHVTRKLRSTAKVSSTDSVMIQESPDTLAGYPYVSSSLVPLDNSSPSDKTSLIFGNWSDLLIGFWSEFDFLVNPYESTAYTKGNVQVRAMATCDVKLRHVESFAFSSTFGFL
jgi:HK97 family phage major capsid protein